MNPKLILCLALFFGGGIHAAMAAEENRDRYIYGLFDARSEAFFTHLVGQVAMELRRQGRAQMEFGHEEKAPPLGTAAAT